MVVPYLTELWTNVLVLFSNTPAISVSSAPPTKPKQANTRSTYSPGMWTPAPYSLVTPAGRKSRTRYNKPVGLTRDSRTTAATRNFNNVMSNYLETYLEKYLETYLDERPGYWSGSGDCRFDHTLGQEGDQYSNVENGEGNIVDVDEEKHDNYDNDFC